MKRIRSKIALKISLLASLLSLVIKSSGYFITDSTTVIKGDVIVTIHLEPEGSHEEVHKTLRDADQERPFEDFI